MENSDIHMRLLCVQILWNYFAGSEMMNIYHVLFVCSLMLLVLMSLLELVYLKFCSCIFSLKFLANFVVNNYEVIH